jgi:hypothetical protein
MGSFSTSTNIQERMTMSLVPLWPARCAICGGAFSKLTTFQTDDGTGKIRTYRRWCCSQCGDTPGSPEQRIAQLRNNDRAPTSRGKKRRK